MQEMDKRNLIETIENNEYITDSFRARLETKIKIGDIFTNEEEAYILVMITNNDNLSLNYKELLKYIITSKGDEQQ